MTCNEIHLQPTRPIVQHIRPTFNDLTFDYTASPSGVDSNLLILFHGLGDTHIPFTRLGQSLNLPQTATLSLCAPTRVPLMEQDSFSWWTSFDSLGELIPSPDPSPTLHILLRLLTHLTTTCSWSPTTIHLFGFAQGGTCAAELSLLYTRETGLSLGSVVGVSAPLLSFPTMGEDKRSGTKVLLIVRKGEEREVGAARWRKGFKEVKEVSLTAGGGMLRGQSEWMEVMRFWSQVLTQRSALELSADTYEIRGGQSAAKAAGAGRQ